jgi:putative acetyltransferase
MELLIRTETAGDHDAIARVNREAFSGDAEAKLVSALRDDGYVRLSLVAELDGQIVGHVLFSGLPIRTAHGTVPALSVAPMAVLPTHQRQGVGTRLLREGLRLGREAGHRIVLVLGHKEYYPRFGFSPELARSIACPFPGVGDHWMALELVPEALFGVTGAAEFPPPFSAFS